MKVAIRTYDYRQICSCAVDIFEKFPYTVSMEVGIPRIPGKSDSSEYVRKLSRDEESP